MRVSVHNNDPHTSGNCIARLLLGIAWPYERMSMSQDCMGTYSRHASVLALFFASSAPTPIVSAWSSVPSASPCLSILCDNTNKQKNRTEAHTDARDETRLCEMRT